MAWKIAIIFFVAKAKSKNGKQGRYSHHIIFFAAHKWAQETKVLNYVGVERLARN